MIEKRDFYIDGQWVAPLAPRDHQVIDPSTEDPCAMISLGSEADADRAVAAAKAAFPAWMATPPADRIAIVETFLEIYERRKEEMAQAISTEMGAPHRTCRAAPSGGPVSPTPRTSCAPPRPSNSCARWAIMPPMTASSTRASASAP